MRIVLACFVLCAVGPARVMGQSAEVGGDWPQWRGPNRDGVSAETEWLAQWPAEGPKRLWAASVGTGCAGVAVVDGRLYTSGNDRDTETVYCLDAETGDKIWAYDFKCALDPRQFEGGPAATPAIDGKRVFSLSRQGDIHCLDATSGEKLWARKAQRDLGAAKPTWGFSGSPLLLGDRVIFNAGVTVAFNKTDGSVAWKTDNRGAAYSSPVAFKNKGGETLLAIFNRPGLDVLRAEDGKRVAKAKWPTSYDVNAATPIVFGELIFISSGYNAGAALLRLKGGRLDQIWRNRVMRNHFSSSVLWEGHLYGFDESRLRCVRFSTGRERWTEGGLGKGTLLAAGGKLIILSEGGELVIAEASPEGFRELARRQVLGGACWVAPVLSGGRLYVKNNNGRLLAFDLRPPGGDSGS